MRVTLRSARAATLLPAALLTATVLTASATAALAGGSAPQRACAGAIATAGDSTLVLGHFRGGRAIRVAGGPALVDWRDDYTCFTSMRACKAWQRDLRVAYRHVEGDRTCMPLR
ncbi:MAG: hypothetical protein K2X62_10925 [Beijerinckiaceae bacterium]|jgi:hypothetical protein|nr:hypothetical protein [Beijerinckiaceae bacterium]